MGFETGARTKKTLSWGESKRKCLKCGELLEFKYFHKQKSGYKGYATVCKECRKEKSKKDYLRQTTEYKLYYSAKYRASVKSIDFSIDLCDIVVQERCPVLGKRYKHCTDLAPSLDRLDNTKGYIKGNVTVMSVRANRMKGDYSVKELKLLLEYLERRV